MLFRCGVRAANPLERSFLRTTILLVAMAALLSLGAPGGRAAVFTWDGGGGNDDWTTPGNWSGDFAPISGHGDELHFAGSTRLAPSNNYEPGANFRSVQFDADAGSFHFTGNALELRDASFAMPMIVNNSSATQTFSLSGTLTFNHRFDAGTAVIDAAAGSLIFNNAVDLASRTEIFVVGTAGNSITFNGGLTSSGNLGNNRLAIDSKPGAAQPFTVIMTGTGNTYAGGTSIYSGALQLGSTGLSAINGSIAGAINLGRDYGGGDPTPAATLVLGGSGSQTFANAIHVTQGGWGSGAKTIAGSFTGTATLAGTVTARGDVTVATAAASTLQFNSVTSLFGNVLVGSAATTNSGTVVFGGNTDNAGVSAIVSSGTLILAKSSSANVHAVNSGVGIDTGGTVILAGTGGDQIADSARMILAGGTFNTAGLSEYSGATNVQPGIGALTLHTTSIIDFANGASILAFSDSSSWGPWNGTLQIHNWTGSVDGNGIDQIYFGTGTNGLTPSQLSQIVFYSDAGVTMLGSGTFARDLDGEVVPLLVAVPEPGTWLAGALALAAVGLSLRRRYSAAGDR